MTNYKAVSTRFFALAMLAGAVMFAPSSAKVGGFIPNPELRHGEVSCSDPAHASQNCRPIALTMLAHVTPTIPSEGKPRPGTRLHPILSDHAPSPFKMPSPAAQGRPETHCPALH